MNNNLPKIFQNKDVRNSTNKKFVYGSKTNIDEHIDINKKINKIFKLNKHISGIDVEIVLDNKNINTKIIAKTNDYLLTDNNKKIYFKDIKNIYEK